MPGFFGSSWYNPYDPRALQAGAQAQQQKQQMYQEITGAGRPVYGSQFQVNPRGAPLFGPITGNLFQQGFFYDYPTAAVTQRLAEMGFSTHVTNPFTQYAVGIAPGLRKLYDILNPPTGDQESQLAGFLAFAQQVPQLLLGPAGNLAGTQFSRRAVGQALRNFAPGEQFGDFTEQYQLVDDILQYIGSLWMTPTWQRIARQDLQQKLDDYHRYMASTNGQGMSFLEFLVGTGFVDRYFG
ncbi:hypothetical protein OO015_00575 [Thermomicrobium sp. 4228-Ro]|uniref:hypothetical protein n=1 Tax=Thermomicrobium sp. 4228-Ro TaxID=2993937 RepID=UPI0022487706|nr:hypothetical protein [Thermomicrobium sp. 4228-Ro]MCX2726002.1 hypothetical protein [Thermomicrobium sp. 4228-Ro]